MIEDPVSVEQSSGFRYSIDAVRAAMKRHRSNDSRRHAEGIITAPRIRVELDGKVVESRDFVYRSGPNLCYVVTPDTSRDETLRVFTNPDGAAEYVADTFTRLAQNSYDTATKVDSRVRSRGNRPAADGSELATTSQALTKGYHGLVGGYVDLYEHVGFTGAKWYFDVGWGTIRDFRKVYPTLWWHTNIDNKVSSVDVNIAYADGNIRENAYVILFEEPNLRGSQLWLWSGAAQIGPGMYDDLGVYGWNDVASSMRYY